MTSVHPLTDVQQVPRVSKGIVQKGQQIGKYTGILILPVSTKGETNLLLPPAPGCDILPNLGQAKGCWSRCPNKCHCGLLCIHLPLWKRRLSIHGSSDASLAWYPIPFFQSWNDLAWRVGKWIDSRVERWLMGEEGEGALGEAHTLNWF